MSGSAPDPVADRAAGASPPEPAAADADAPSQSEVVRPRSERSGGARPIRIELEASRQRSASWTIFGLIFGGLLIRGLGTVGVWVGIALVAMGIYHAWRLIQTMLYPPGTIEVSEHEVSLPRGLCMPRPVVVHPSDITAIYFLRRSVPWNRSAPVLVIELGTRAMAYPRDWFASEADQRHVIHAVLRSKGQAPKSQSSAGSAGSDGSDAA